MARVGAHGHVVGMFAVSGLVVERSAVVPVVHAGVFRAQLVRLLSTHKCVSVFQHCVCIASKTHMGRIHHAYNTLGRQWDCCWLLNK